MIASTSAVLAGVLILVTSEGPVAGCATGFKLGDVKAYWTNRGIRFANLGYLGHMWELFAMYAWIGFYLSPELAQDAAGEDADPIAALATFGRGCLGSPGRGYRRLGRRPGWPSRTGSAPC